MPSSLPANPLPACPGTPNCIRETRTFDRDADALFEEARAALDELGASEVEADTASRRLDAVFRVFFFKDDVAIQVARYEDGSVLHIRSASRVGSFDWGVNGRRVRRFYTALR